MDSLAETRNRVNPQLSLFDYNQLDNTDVRLSLQQRAQRINERSRRMAQDTWENGQDFYEAQQELAKPGRYSEGLFVKWAESETGYSKSTVYNMIAVYQRLNLPNFGNFKIAVSALYLLAAPSTPDEARQEAIDRAASGETITHSAAKDIVNGHKPPAPDNGYDIEADETDEPPARDWLFNSGAPAETFTPTLTENIDDSPDLDERPFNYKRDMKASREENIYIPQGYDACQTPPYAIDPLLPYLPAGAVIWEPAAGENGIVEALYDSGFEVIPSDILTGQNFFEYEPDNWGAIATNPPFSIKFKWLARCYELGKPFALLLPVETLGAQTAQRLFEAHGLELILLDKRVNFKMPNKGWDGGGAQFPVAWFTHGLGIGKEIIYGRISDEQVADWNRSIQQRQAE